MSDLSSTDSTQGGPIDEAADPIPSGVPQVRRLEMPRVTVRSALLGREDRVVNRLWYLSVQALQQGKDADCSQVAVHVNNLETCDWLMGKAVLRQSW